MGSCTASGRARERQTLDTSKRDPATATGVDPVGTEVGSVFVSNYPPYSFWSTDRVDEARRALDSAPAAEDPGLGVYLHIPFCRKRCKFCYYKVYTEKNSSEVETYLDAVLRETGLVAGSAALRDRPVRFVYFGGGTPSFIAAKHLKALVAGLRSELPLDQVEEVTFECEPGTLTQAKLEAIREVGVTRLSLGVESFVDEILEENGRAHLSKEIRRVLPWIEATKFDQLNIDLISGMVGESWDTWKQSVKQTLELQPDSVTIYQMELPFNTVYSRRVLDGAAVPVADWDLKRAWHEYAIDEMSAAGYEVSSAYTMVRKGAGTRFAYRDSLWRGADLLGLGVSSFSHVNGAHYQNESGWGPYIERVRAGELPIQRAFVPSADEKLTREMILQLKLGRIDPAYFSVKFGVEILKRYEAAFHRLQKRGMLEIEGAVVLLTRAGLLRVDQLLPEFYEARYQNARYT